MKKTVNFVTRGKPSYGSKILGAEEAVSLVLDGCNGAFPSPVQFPGHNSDVVVECDEIAVAGVVGLLR